MIRTCPKCGDYYADALLAFCPADGIPLVNVSPHSESWSEGTRVIEEKESSLKRQKRKLKWRRIVQRAMTTLMVTMVVYVVAANSYIYLKPGQGEVAQADPSTPDGVPTGLKEITPSPPPSETPTPSPSASSSPSASPSPSPSASASASPSPSASASASPSPSVSVSASPSPSISASPSPSVSTTTACSDDDKSLEGASIKQSYHRLWLEQIRSEEQIIAGNSPAESAPDREGSRRKPDPVKVGLRYEFVFFEACTVCEVTIRYQPDRARRNPATGEEVRVFKQKTSHCVKRGGAWVCNQLISR